MGCAKSTQNGGRGGGGGSGDLKGDEKPPPQTDPRLPLTAKQKYNLVASWKGISRAMEPTGITMFIKKQKKFFPSFVCLFVCWLLSLWLC
ncbi:hypothetical protein Phum_PHUM286960 [Pediculus humanus corporis]|uniref:Neuroglobin n=1 Tax=Pediculus humanus subsp. corporis TaxID=121224 RepID=E0VLE4_PEDHC|nr:uncharacterized protein Phum_PHUM286960 [Pediculus humanus corporis]EEB14200.1 hypothetical protein Phum_PHUM286960 [Pediculus humanus corporis]